MVLSSEYPSKRFVQGSDDLFEGVAGSLQLVEETGVSSQHFDHSMDSLPPFDGVSTI